MSGTERETCAGCPFLTVEDYGHEFYAYICKKGWLDWPTRTLGVFNGKHPSLKPDRPAWCDEKTEEGEPNDT